MGKDSSVQWCHSSANWQMGCDGCELWSKTIKKCYAGKQTQGMEGKKGWPLSFDEPKLFLERVDPTLKWGPPTDHERDKKPWIPRDYPRIIFLNDMGDTFSRKLPQNWMAPLLPLIAKSAHQYLVLTKRPSALAAFAEKYPLPENLWPGTTFTSAPTEARIRELRKIRSGGPKFVSFEPLWSMIPPSAFEGIDWAIFGGESGEREHKPTPTPVEWIERGTIDAALHGVRRFVKQLGSRPMKDGHPLILRDFHGGDWNEAEFPTELRIREFPTISMHTQTALL